MLSTAALAETAALIGDPARAAMLTSLMDGRALTAAELARAAGVTAQTASGHLARLTAAGLLAMERQGRHRYHRLGSAAVAQMLESMMSVAANPSGPRPRKVVTGPRQVALRQARTCFDHLAGVLAVAIADRMVARGHVEWGADGGPTDRRWRRVPDRTRHRPAAERHTARRCILPALPGLERATAAHRGTGWRGAMPCLPRSGLGAPGRGQPSADDQPGRAVGTGSRIWRAPAGLRSPCLSEPTPNKPSTSFAMSG